jgi:transcriptional regulator with XRE-family HTH domain
MTALSIGSTYGGAAADSRRAELVAFLRSRRARLRPTDVGLAPGFGPRRTPGLRREEVAQLAGVGITWYTWLEQGRSINPSPQVVDALSRALRLDGHERRHLATLCGLERPDPVRALDEVSGSIRAILASLDPNPAYITNARYDVLAWNRAITGLYGDFALLPHQDRNILWLLFTEPSWRKLLVDYTEVASYVVAQFRAAMGSHLGDAAWSELVDRLCSASATFRECWSRYEVAGPQTRTKRYMHPRVGPLTLNYTLLRPAESPGNRLLIYTPADEASREAIRRLVPSSRDSQSTKHRSNGRVTGLRIAERRQALSTD